jgi:flavodoxin short chain
MKVNVIYWSSTGNTEIMARGIYDAVFKNKSIEVKLFHVSDATVDHIKEADLVVLGASAMSVETIDDSEMAPFIVSNKSVFKNKSVALFGSYDWGDGEWLRTWQEMMIEIETKVILAPLMVANEPDEEGMNLCHGYGEKIIDHLNGVISN